MRCWRLPDQTVIVLDDALLPALLGPGGEGLSGTLLAAVLAVIVVLVILARRSRRVGRAAAAPTSCRWSRRPNRR